jgi:hypothetical protein
LRACGTRALTYGCEPFLKKIEAHAERLMRFERFQKVAGLEPVAAQPIITGTQKE